MNKDDVSKFYRYFKHTKPTEIFTLDKNQKICKDIFWVDNENDFIKQVEKSNKENNVYIGFRDRVDKNNEGVISSSHIYVEIDEHDIKKSDQLPKLQSFLKEHEIEIGMIGFSGGGFHLYIPHKTIIFQNKQQKEAYSRFLLRFRDLLITNGIDIDEKVSDLQRLSRVLGTYNHKRKEQSKILYQNEKIDLERQKQKLYDLVGDFESPISPSGTSIISSNNTHDNATENDSSTTKEAIEILKKYSIDKEHAWLYDIIANGVIIPSDTGANSVFFKNCACICGLCRMNDYEIQIIGKSLADKCTDRTLASFMGWVQKMRDNTIGEINKTEINNTIDKYNHKLTKYTNEQTKTEQKNKKEFKILSMNDLKNYETPEYSWRIENILQDKKIISVSGPSTVYKSWFCLLAGICVSSGKPFLDTFSVEQGNVLFIDRENSLPELQNRTEMLCKGLNMNDFEKLPMYFLSEQAFYLDEPEDLKFLEELIIKNKIVLILIDVYRRCVRFQEDKADDVARFFGNLKPVCERTGVSFILLHHHKKGTNIDKKELLRGSSDFLNNLDGLLQIDKRGQQLSVTHSKSRSGKELEPFNLKVETDEEDYFKFEYLGEKQKDYSLKTRAVNVISVWLTENNIKVFKTEEVRKLCKSAGIHKQNTFSALVEMQRNNSVIKQSKGVYLNNLNNIVSLSKNIK